jgi:hypothetical protein
MTPTRLLVSGLFLLGCTAVLRAAPPTEGVEFFEKKVRPLLVEHCQSCHGPKRQQAGLRLDTRADFLKGGDTGPIVKPGKPDESLLVRAVRHGDDVKMPPKGKLPDAAVEALTRWVQMGVPWPEEKQTTARAGAPSVENARKSHWAFQPPKMPALPSVRGVAPTPIDRFILAKLEAKGLRPNPPADRRTLLRRVTLDVTGLPPTLDEIEAFVNDSSPDAFAKVVDRLLSSPAYGERWGRHWLDISRYADTKGYVFEEERRYPFAYTYRDWVIRALNEDLPYDQFILQQLAADRLVGDDKQPLAAMGFLTLGRRFLNNQNDIIDDRIDVVSRGLMGLTVACARCHDHKFDPIPTKDYYSLHGIFASSQEPKELPVLAMSGKPTPEQEAFEKERQRLQAEVDEYEKKFEAELKARNRMHRNELRKRQQKVDALKATHPGAPASAMVLVDAPKPVQPVVFVRGIQGNRGESVPRQFLAVLSGEKREPFTDGSGRLELAKAIASRDNPLTARVFVNRVWMHYFGAGIVRTPGDFGLRGDPPTHPELLDWLALRFVEDGWSMKKLHRTILLSQTYQQASTINPSAAAADPENRLVWRMARKRLEFEPLRDAMLATSGKLDRTAGGAPVDILKAPFSGRRTVYGFIDRQNLPGVFRTFDLASPDTSTPQRHVTTVPQQALFLMNNPFVAEQAKALAARPDVQARTAPEERVRHLGRLVLGRDAEPDEVTLGCQFVASAEEIRKLKGWEQYAQVLLLSNEFAFVD